MARYFNLYYYNKLRPKAMFNKVLNNAIFWTQKIAAETGLAMDKSYDLASAFMGYRIKYKNDTLIPLAVEKGFTKLLYEDDMNRFSYEGSIDLTALNPKKMTIIDHKSESANRPIYEHNNQAIGYLYATGATEFMYNYVTLTKVPEYHRRVHVFTEAQIAQWVSNTTEWFFRAKSAILQRRFLPSLQCVGIYGVCPFHRICEQPKDNIKQIVIATNYKRRKPYRSWS